MEGLVTIRAQAFCVLPRVPNSGLHVPNMYQGADDRRLDVAASLEISSRAVVDGPAACHGSFGARRPNSPSGSGRVTYSDVSAPTEPLLDIGGLAERLGVGDRFVRRLVNERRIPFLKIGRHVRFDVADVEAWIRDSRIEPAQPFTPRPLAASRS